MYLNFIYLITAFLGYITIYLIGFKFKYNRHTNAYLIIFFFISSTRFLIYGMLDVPLLADKLYFFNVLFTAICWPCLYLYFVNLVQNRSEIKAKEGLHFIIPLLILSLAVFQFLWTESSIKIIKRIAIFINLSMNAIYYYSSYKILSKSIWNRNSEISLINNQNKAIKKWSSFLFGLFSLMFLIYLIRFFVSEKTFWHLNQNSYLWIAALIWMVMYLKILSDPEFLYGYDVLQTKIKEYKKRTIVLDNIWKMELAETGINAKDGILKEKIQDSIESYIVEIEHLALHSSMFFKETFSADELANKLGIPKSHLLYVFKYHANLSFSDFKKVIRIQKAIAYMEGDYLKNNMMESLAIEVGFSSYSPFFKSFKTITGLSPQEYYNKSN